MNSRCACTWTQKPVPVAFMDMRVRFDDGRYTLKSGGEGSHSKVHQPDA